MTNIKDYKEIREIIKDYPLFDATKNAKILARPGIIGEIIEVVCSDGRVETVQTVGPDQIVIKNIDGAGEEYVVKKEAFEPRYDLIEELPTKWNKYKSKGTIKGIFITQEILEELTDTDVIEFKPPWGGKMIAVKDDVFAISDTTGDLYRIARAEFDKTYVIKE